MANAFDQFDEKAKGNPFDKFDTEPNLLSEAAHTAGDMVASGLQGLANFGATAVDAANPVNLAKAAYNVVPSLNVEDVGKNQQTGSMDALKATQDIYKPETYFGEMSKRFGEALPMGAPAAIMNMASKPGEDIGGQIGQQYGYEGLGRTLGGFAGAAFVGSLPSLTERAQSVIAKRIAPTLEPDTAKIVQRAQEMGVPLSLTQIAPSRMRGTIQKISQAIPASGVQAFEDSQVGAWNKALSKTIGLDADKLSPEMVKTFLDKSHTGYENALSGVKVQFGKDTLDALQAIAKEAPDVMEESLAKTVTGNVNSVIEQIKAGTLSGEKVNSIRRSLLDKAGKASGEIKSGIMDAVGVLQDGIEKSLPADRVEAIKTLNRQYRNFKTVEPLLEKSVDGRVNPTQLLQRVASSKYIKGSRAETGSDDLVDLARIGKMMPKLGGSDTFEKGMYAGAGLTAGGAGAYLEPTSAAAIVGGNRGYQKLYNQSQGLVKKSVEKSMERK